MSLGDEFYVSLPSNVPGHPNNVTEQYETTLARPLDLPGIWEVALIDINIPHTWMNLDKDYTVTIAIEADDSDENMEFHIRDKKQSISLINVAKDLSRFNLQSASNQFLSIEYKKYSIKQSFTLVPGQYDLKT